MTGSRPAAIAFGARILALASTFAMNVVIAQTLPLADAGTVVLVMTLVTTFATVARFGTDNLALRTTAGDAGLMRTLVRPMVLLVLLIAAVASLGFVVAAALVMAGDEPAHVGWILAAGGACVAPAALSVLAGSVLRGAGRLGAGTMAELGSVPILVSAGLLVAAAAGEATVLVAVATTCLAFGFTAVWSGVAGWRVLPHLKGSAQSLATLVGSRGRSLLHMFVASLATFFMMWIPVLALGYAGTSEEVAIYNAGARLAAFVGLIAAIQVTYLATEFAKLGAIGDAAQITRVAQRATRLAAAVAGMIGTALIAFPALFLGLFGSAYSAAAPVLIALTLGALVQVVAGPSIAVMLTCGIESTASRLTFLACAVGVVACPLLAFRGPGSVAGVAAVLIAMPAVVGAVLLRRRGIYTSLALGER